jgi:hypothetical protein
VLSKYISNCCTSTKLKINVKSFIYFKENTY